MSESKKKASLPKFCSHYKSGLIALYRIVEKLQSSSNQHSSCQECSHDSTEPISLWICVSCEKCFCSDKCSLFPAGHASDHSSSFNHPLAILSDVWSKVFCIECGFFQPIIRDEGENMKVESAGDAISGAAGKRFEQDAPANPIVKKLAERFDQGLILRSGLKRTYTIKEMPNHGNTCFFNSILQNLLAMNQLKHLVCSLRPVWNITKNMQNLYIEQHSDDFILDPKVLLDSIRAETKVFEVGKQYDSQELLQFLINELEREDPSVVDKTFRGKFCSIVSCAQCGRQSEQYDLFLELSLQVPSKMSSTKTNDGKVYQRILGGGDINEDEDVERVKELKMEGIAEDKKLNFPDTLSDSSDEDKSLHEVFQKLVHKGTRLLSTDKSSAVSTRLVDLNVGQSSNNMDAAASESEICVVDDTNGPLSVEGCLKLFTGEENLRGISCEQCAHNEQRKRLLIASAPPILTIHLKRFRLSATRSQMKIKGQIEFQEILDLTPFMNPSVVGNEVFMYRLTGVVEHIGNTLKSGHYVTFVYREQSHWDEEVADPAWFKASDSIVQKVTLDEVLRCEAYLLFFERVQE